MKANYIRILGAGTLLVLLAGLSYVWAGGLIFSSPTPQEDASNTGSKTVIPVAAVSAESSLPASVLVPQPLPGQTLAGNPPDGETGFKPNLDFQFRCNKSAGEMSPAGGTPPDILEPDDDGSSFAVGATGVRTPNLDFQFRQEGNVP